MSAVAVDSLICQMINAYLATFDDAFEDVNLGLAPGLRQEFALGQRALLLTRHCALGGNGQARPPWGQHLGARFSCLPGLALRLCTA